MTSSQWCSDVVRAHVLTRKLPYWQLSLFWKAPVWRFPYVREFFLPGPQGGSSNTRLHGWDDEATRDALLGGRTMYTSYGRRRSGVIPLEYGLLLLMAGGAMFSTVSLYKGLVTDMFESVNSALAVDAAL